MKLSNTDLLLIEKDLIIITEKISNGTRINLEEGIMLFEQADLGLLGYLANIVNRRKNGLNVYFNKNIHIEPTNQCIYHCKFCSYYRKKGETGWEYSITDMLEMVSKLPMDVKEVHVVGGVHPKWDVHFFGKMFRQMKEIRPDIHIKAFTAVEISHLCKKANLSIKEGLAALKEYGLDSIPGGGAEIFDEEIRNQICPHKDTAEQWLYIHKTAHQLDIKSNATILYGHIEEPKHRLEHLLRLRNLQDETKGFNVFIPLKFKNKNNELSYLAETSIIDDLKMFAISRIFLDNFNHIKAYWPMLGKDVAQLSLSFGVDDLDGTINDTTKIYSLAGAEEQQPTMTTNDMIQLIKSVNKIPVERDSVYNVIKMY
jgi:aminodeoxyfutalosine synthase